MSGAWLVVDALAILGAAFAGGGLFANHPVGRWSSFLFAASLWTSAAVLGVRAWRRGRGESAAGDSKSVERSSEAPRANGESLATPRVLRFGEETIDTLAALQKVVARICCQHADGSGRVRGEESREFFARLDVTAVLPFVAAAELRKANEFTRLLDRIATGLGEPPAERLVELRAAIPAALTPAVERAAATLGAARDLQAFREALTDGCCEHSDGRGWIVVAYLPKLLARITSEQVHGLLQTARPKTLAGLARLVGALSRQLSAPCAELEVLRGALLDAGRHWLPTTQQADWIVPFVAGLCCERIDGGGKVDREAVRRLFDGLSFTRLGDRLSHVAVRELNGTAQCLSRLAAGLPEPHPPGFRSLLDAIDAAIELGAIRHQNQLLNAVDVAGLRRTIVEVCCEDDDGGGFQNRRAFHALFEGMVAEHFRPLIEAASPADRLRLSQMANRIDTDRRGESLSPSVLAFRELLSKSVERDRAEAPQRSADVVEARRARAHADATEVAEEDAAHDASGELSLTWQHFKQANLVACSPELAAQFGRLLDEISRDGEDGLRRILRRLWKGLRRDQERLTIDIEPHDLANEWARKRYLAESLARGADRRAVPKLVALFEGRCEDPDYLETVQPALAKALVAMRDKRAVAALKGAQESGVASPATKRVIATAKHARRREGEVPG